MTDPIVAAAEFLSAQLGWLRHARTEQGGAYAEDVFAEIRDCAAKLRSLVEGPAQQKYLGPCGAPTTYLAPGGDDTEYVGRDCEGDVYARPGAETGRCRSCGATVRTEERRAWLDDVVRGYAYRASEIEDAYGVKANTIRQWATPERGLLRVHDRDFLGRARYLLGDVLDVARDQKLKAAVRAAERERRAAGRASA